MAATGAATNAPPVVSGTTDLPTKSGSSLASNTGATLAGNFQTFLTLLTTQLQNQNPLDPLDTNQFTQQLVQFAGVEQQLKTNDQLTSLIAMQQTAQSTQALGFVGKTAVVDGSTATLTKSQAVWDVSMAKAANVTLTITNGAGQTVFNNTYPVDAGDNQPFVWDGKGKDGVQWPDGKYTLTATTTDVDGKTTGVPTRIQGTVSSVDLTQSPPLLTINGQTYTVSQVKAIVR